MSNDQSADIPDQEEFTDSSPNPARDIDLAILCDDLQEHDIKRVVVHYDGSGDSGCVEETEYGPEDNSLPDWLDTKLRELAEEYCPAGYENNEGGYGTLTVYPFEGLAKLEHIYRLEDSEDMGVGPTQLPPALRKKLSRAGITGITAHFDGYGDSGQIEEFNTEPEDLSLDVDLARELEDFLVEQLPGGWENNAGGWGELLVDVASGEVDTNGYFRVDNESDTQTTAWKWRQ